MKPVIFGAFCAAYCLKRYYDYSQHKKAYEDSHQKANKAIEQIAQSTLQNHRESLERQKHLTHDYEFVLTEPFDYKKFPVSDKQLLKPAFGFNASSKFDTVSPFLLSSCSSPDSDSKVLR